MSAIDIAPRIGVPAWCARETRRRRVRDAVTHARKILADRGESVALVASAEGYALTAGRDELRAYLGRRRRSGLTDLAEVGRVNRSPATDAATGQARLFDRTPSAPPALRAW